MRSVQERINFNKHTRAEVENSFRTLFQFMYSLRPMKVWKFVSYALGSKLNLYFSFNLKDKNIFRNMLGNLLLLPLSQLKGKQDFSSRETCLLLDLSRTSKNKLIELGTRNSGFF